MSKLKFLRGRSTHYDVTKKKTIEDSENDTIVERFETLLEARARGLELFKSSNFKSLVNSHGVNLTL